MHPPPLFRPRLIAVGLGLLLASLVVAGCSSDRPARRGAHFQPAPPIGGQEKFFDRKITAEVLVGALTGFQPGDGGPGAGGKGRGGRMRGHLGGGAGGLNGGFGGGGRRSERGDSASPEDDGGNSMALRRADLAGAPPVMIHVRFTNSGTERAELEITDFLSPLGNFVVNPEKLTLAPGESSELEPMTSRLAGDVTGANVTLALKLGAATESKTIELKLVPNPSPPTPPTPPAN